MRRERRQSLRSEAYAAHAKAKTELLQIRIMEKHRTLVRRDAVDGLIDQISGTVLTHLSGMPARGARRVVILRSGAASSGSCTRSDEIAAICQQMADKNGEPPLEQQV